MSDSSKDSNEEVTLSGEIENELERLAHDPRGEVKRLHDVAHEGESAATPLIELATIVRWVVPLAVLMIGIAFAAYFAAR